MQLALRSVTFFSVIQSRIGLCLTSQNGGKFFTYSKISDLVGYFLQVIAGHPSAAAAAVCALKQAYEELEDDYD